MGIEENNTQPEEDGEKTGVEPEKPLTEEEQKALESVYRVVTPDTSIIDTESEKAMDSVDKVISNEKGVVIEDDGPRPGDEDLIAHVLDDDFDPDTLTDEHIDALKRDPAFRDLLDTHPAFQDDAKEAEQRRLREHERQIREAGAVDAVFKNDLAVESAPYYSEDLTPTPEQLAALEAEAEQLQQESDQFFANPENLEEYNRALAKKETGRIAYEKAMRLAGRTEDRIDPGFDQVMARIRAGEISKNAIKKAGED